MAGTAAQKLRGLDGFFYFKLGSPVSCAGVTTSASAAFSVASGAGIAVGQVVSGTGIPLGTTVLTFSGTSGTLSANATATGTPTLTFTPVTAKIAHCAGWEMNIKADEIDASDHDANGWKDKLAGLKEFSGTIDLMYFTNDATQLSVIDAVLAGNVTIGGDFRPLDSTGEVNYTGNLIITDFKQAAKGSTAQAINLTFAGRGPLTRGAIS
jgi:predicted secreted protein